MQKQTKKAQNTLTKGWFNQKGQTRLKNQLNWLNPPFF